MTDKCVLVAAVFNFEFSFEFFLQLVGTSMAIDSKIAFRNRALELGVTADDIDSLSDAGISSYATFAHCCNFQPGQSDDLALIQFLTTALGAEPAPAEKAKLRRFYFEAHALSLEDLKSRAD